MDMSPKSARAAQLLLIFSLQFGQAILAPLRKLLL